MQTSMTQAELNIEIQANQGKADYQRSIQQAAQIRALAEAEAERVARVGIAQALATEEQVRAYGGPQFQVTQQVLQKFADAIQQSGVDVVPRVMISGDQKNGQGGTGSVIEALLAMLLSEKLSTASSEYGQRSPEAEKLRSEIRQKIQGEQDKERKKK